MPDIVRPYSPNQQPPGGGHNRVGGRVFQIVFGPVQGQSATFVRLRSKTAVPAGIHASWSLSILVGGFGHIYVAPYGTPAPTSATSALDAGFKSMGYLSEAGARFSESKEIVEKSSWTSFYPKEFVIMERQLDVDFELMQWNKQTVEFALEGTATAAHPNHSFRGNNADSVKKALVLDLEDKPGTATHNLRLYLPQGVPSGDVPTTIARTEAAKLPIRFSATHDDSNTYTIFVTHTEADTITQY